TRDGDRAGRGRRAEGFMRAAASMRRAASLAGALALVLAPAPAVPAQEPDATTPKAPYHADYEVRIVPTERSARVTIRIDDPENGLLSFRFSHDPERHLDFSGDGDVLVEERWVAWTPPKLGGLLRYTVRIDNLRNEHSY